MFQTLRVNPSVQSPPLLRRKTFAAPENFSAGSSRRREPRPSAQSKGRFERGLGNPHGVGGMKGYVTRAPFRKLTGAARVPHGTVPPMIAGSPKPNSS